MENIFHDVYEKLTTDTRAHADVFNTIFDQLFQNDRLLKESQEIEYIYEGSVLEFCKQKGKSFKFIAYNDTGRGSSNSIIDLPKNSMEVGGNVWYGEFSRLDKIAMGISHPAGIDIKFSVKNLAGDSFINIGTITDEVENGTISEILWSGWKQVTGYQVLLDADIHLLETGKYYIYNGTSLPDGCRQAYIEVIDISKGFRFITCYAYFYNNDGYKPEHSIGMYIKEQDPYWNIWSDWKCISNPNTKAVYVGEAAPTDNSNIWMW